MCVRVCASLSVYVYAHARTLKLSGTVHWYDNRLESALVDLNASKVTPIRVKAGVAVKARI